MNKLGQIKRKIFNLRNKLDIMTTKDIDGLLWNIQEEVALLHDHSLLPEFFFFVQICDPEACWYHSVWNNIEDAENEFDKYKCSNSYESKRLGKRLMNSLDVGEYIKTE